MPYWSASQLPHCRHSSFLTEAPSLHTERREDKWIRINVKKNYIVNSSAHGYSTGNNIVVNFYGSAFWPFIFFTEKLFPILPFLQNSPFLFFLVIIKAGH